MSAVPHPQPRPAQTELETVVNWRLIGAAASAAVVLLVVPVTAALLLSPAAQPPKAPPAGPPVALAPQVPHFVLPVRAVPPATAPQPEVPAVEELPSPPAAPTPPPAPKPPPVAAPAPTRVAAAPPRVPEKPVGFRRWNRVSDYYVFDQLAKAPPVDLDAVPGTVAKVQAAAKKAATTPPKDKKVAAAPPVEPLADLLAQRPDLNGLPFRMGADCRASSKAVRKMQQISTDMRRSVAKIAPPRSPSMSEFPGYLRAQALVEDLRRHQAWHDDDGASTVTQILQPEIVYARRQAVTWLSDIRGPRASAALANLAVFDLSADVREDAVAALRKRPRAEYRDALLRALRYPWPTAADHAAEALVDLGDVSAVPSLVALLDQPDPAAPVRQGDKWVVSELVRVNHMRNCYLCHAPAQSVKGPIPGLVPTPGQELPVVYYQSARGPFVRADVTYLRQDFSLMQRVEKPDRWPDWQRFDFLVRTRALTPQEAAAWEKGMDTPRPTTYPQREAVLFALRELTGEDVGRRSEDWQRFLTGPWLEHEL
jgi:hypothetical protein